MKQVKSALCMLALFFATLPSLAHAEDHCSIDIAQGVEVNRAKLRVFDKDKTLFEIDKNGQLWIEGKSVALNSEQQELTKTYFQQVQIAVPEIIEMATRIVELTAKQLHASFGEAFGKDSGMVESIDALMLNVKKSIALSMSKKDGVYRIAPDGDEQFENAFGDEFEKEVEAMVERALGSILWMVAKSMLNGEGNLEKRAQALGDKIEKSVKSNMENIEKEVEISAKKVCCQMATLSRLEAQMRREIPSFAPYVVFKKN
ncbi:MAG: DUF2884 family protein [Myxococcota bacterium]|nr:DUF2884 family protein [Myxococcota bacterium]